MLNKRLLFILAAASMLVACGGSSEKVEKTPQCIENVQTARVMLHKLPNLYVEDTCQVGNNSYAWTIDRVASDSLPIVEDDMGFRYADNKLRITLRKNGVNVYSKNFLKKDFAHLLDREFYANSILDGCRFLKVEEGVAVFSMAVSYPESDMSQPFKLFIHPDGSMRLVKDDEIVDEYVSDSLVKPAQ